MQTKINSFKLKIKDEKNQQTFKNYYSGGPCEGNATIIETKYKEFKEWDIQKIIKIQRFLRRVRILKIIKRIKKHEFEKKVYLYQKKLDNFIGNHSAFYQAMRINESAFKLRMVQQKRNIENLNELFLNMTINKSRSSTLTDQSSLTPKSRFKTITQDSINTNAKTNAFNTYFQGSDPIYESKASDFGNEVKHSNEQLPKKQIQIKQHVPQPHSNLAQMKRDLAKQQIDKQAQNNSTTCNTTLSTRHQTFYSKESTQPKSDVTQSFTGTRKSQLLVKQTKLIASAKSNFFLSIKNSGFLFTPQDTMMRDSLGNSSLYYSVLHQNEEFVSWLLNKGASPNQVCSFGNTPMHIAFQKQSQQIIQNLLAWGGDINKINLEGFTPLAYCSSELLDKLGLSKCVIYSSRQKFEKNISNFDNHQHLFRRKVSEILPVRLELDNFYPLDVSEHRTIQLINQKSE